VNRRTIGCAALLFLVSGAGVARADGNQQHSETYRKSALGLHVVTSGVGLSGRRNSAAAVPLTTADLVVAGLPASATIEKSFLYWVTYAPTGTGSINVNGTSVPGTLIGTSGQTCWPEEAGARQNFVYRADVTTRINANGSYELTGFPSGADADTQGASVFMVYRDPNEQQKQGSIILRDGALTTNGTNVVTQDIYPQARVPDGLQSARWHLASGDGQSVGVDGQLIFQEFTLPAADGIQHFKSTKGFYWDQNVYDVKERLPNPGVLDIKWAHALEADCIVFPYSALEMHSPPFDAGADDGDGGNDAGSSSGSSGSSGGGASSGTVPGDGGKSGDPGGTAGGAAPEDSSDGCGCRAVTSSISPAAAVVGLFAAAILGLRRHRRRE
jgi:uncharacterized membrane protein YgcG